MHNLPGKIIRLSVKMIYAKFRKMAVLWWEAGQEAEVAIRRCTAPSTGWVKRYFQAGW